MQLGWLGFLQNSAKSSARLENPRGFFKIPTNPPPGRAKCFTSLSAGLQILLWAEPNALQACRLASRPKAGLASWRLGLQNLDPSRRPSRPAHGLCGPHIFPYLPKHVELRHELHFKRSNGHGEIRLTLTLGPDFDAANRCWRLQ